MHNTFLIYHMWRTQDFRPESFFFLKNKRVNKHLEMKILYSFEFKTILLARFQKLKKM